MAIRDLFEIRCDRCGKYELNDVSEPRTVFGNWDSRWCKVRIEYSGVEHMSKRIDLCAECFAMFEKTCRDFMEGENHE